LADTPDISEYAQFHWYQHVWYIDPRDNLNREKLARHIGVAPNIGAKMTWWIIPESCKVIVRNSVAPLLPEELTTSGVQERIQSLNESIQSKIGDKVLDKFLDKSLDLSEISMEKLQELNSFSEDKSNPMGAS
jgi:hypothetical protein